MKPSLIIFAICVLYFYVLKIYWPNSELVLISNVVNVDGLVGILGCGAIDRASVG